MDAAAWNAGPGERWTDEPGPEAPEEEEMNAATKNWREDFIAMRAALPKILKDSTNPHFKSKYATLDAILDAILPVLTEHGFFIVQPVQTWETGQTVVRTELHHVTEADKPVLASSYPVTPDPNPQKVGSAVTYARRYGLCALLGIAAEEDDDGNSASPSPRSSQGPTTPRSSSPQGSGTDRGGDEAKRAIGRLWGALGESFGNGSPWDKDQMSGGFTPDALSKQAVIRNVLGESMICPEGTRVPNNNKMRAMVERDPGLVVERMKERLDEAIAAEKARRAAEDPEVY